ncbi:hypothetical protein HY214_03900 [Candidatus Roizmanbacteria bacterium]|nr:hypothetical protein [Candidatus Roizmanbacteria bacterium]
MTGSNDSKIQGAQSGQILLMLVMLLTTALTVVLATSFKSTTDVQIAKLEEESQKALETAQAGLEYALKNNVNLAYSSSLLNVPSGFTGSASFSTAATTAFVSPLLPANDQYTYYLADYNPSGNAFSNYFNGTIYVYVKSESGCPAAELTTVSSTNTISKYLIDPCNLVTNNGAKLTTVAASPLIYNGAAYNFSYKATSLPTLSNQKFMFVRLLQASSRIGVEYISGSSVALNNQGRLVVSQASSPTGVTKKIQLFQSYPQIPADFFITSY